MIADEHDRRCLRNHAAFCDFSGIADGHVVLKAQHGPSSLVNLRNWVYSRRVDVLVAGKRLRDGRRDNYYGIKVASKNCGVEAIPRRRAVLKIKHAGPPVEGPAPHRTAGLEYFQSIPVGRN